MICGDSDHPIHTYVRTYIHNDTTVDGFDPARVGDYGDRCFLCFLTETGLLLEVGEKVTKFIAFKKTQSRYQ